MADMSYGYSVESVLDAWHSDVVTTSAITATPTLAIALSTTSATAGNPITVETISAEVNGTPDATYSGSKTIAWSGLTASPSGQMPSLPPSSLTFTGGVASPGSTFTPYREGNDRLTATDADARGVTGSVSLTVNAAGAETISTVSGSGQSAQVDSRFSNPLVAEVVDAYRNPVSGVSVSFAGAYSGPGETFGTCSRNPNPRSCVAITDVEGRATSSSLMANTSSGVHLISASATGAGATDFSETNDFGAASMLVFAPSAPGPGTVGSPILNVAVSVEDSFGNIVTSQSGAVTVVIQNGPQTEFTSGTITVNLVSGTARFSDLEVGAAGVYSLAASSNDLSGVVTTTSSESFTVNVTG